MNDSENFLHVDMDFNVAFSEDMVEVCREAIDVFPASHQTAKAVEELNECSTALARALQFNPDIENIQEELADVFIVGLQMSMLFGSPEVFEALDQKLQRLKWTIMKEKNEQSN